MRVYILYLVRPHEADKENDGKSNSEDIDSPQPGTLLSSQQEALDETWLQDIYTGTMYNVQILCVSFWISIAEPS